MTELIRNIEKQTIRVHGEQVLLTKDDINKASEWYAKNAQACIDEAVKGDVFVNDLDSYVKSCEQDIENYETGNFKPWLGFWQQALYLKTGECVSIL
ncbi:hypothetical protein [Pseudoalteromonas phage PH357]|nr:hypothetical protein [Pseudoalteromonas phage PH357]